MIYILKNMGGICISEYVKDLEKKIEEQQGCIIALKLEYKRLFEYISVADDTIEKQDNEIEKMKEYINRLEKTIKERNKEIKKLKEDYEEVREYLRIEISHHIDKCI